MWWVLAGVVLRCGSLTWAAGPAAGARGCLPVPGYNSLIHASSGDLNLGVIVFGRDYSADTLCANTLKSASLLHVSVV